MAEDYDWLGLIGNNKHCENIITYEEYYFYKEK